MLSFGHRILLMTNHNEVLHKAMPVVIIKVFFFTLLYIVKHLQNKYNFTFSELLQAYQ